MIKLYNEDCMIGMKRFADKEFDLAIVDPPYGIEIMKQWGNVENGYKQYEKKDWDNAVPPPIYFQELQRVSKNQVIWGGNYFDLPPTQCWLIWDKGQRGFSMADGELAWTSFDKAMRIKTIHRSKLQAEGERFHPTQKPVALYGWILDKLAKPNDKILDTHLGSGSIAIACHDAGYSLTGFEIDKDYYDKAVKRLAMHQSQQQLFKRA